MTDVLPSCIGMEELLYMLYSGFVQANKSHDAGEFQVILLGLELQADWGEVGYLDELLVAKFWVLHLQKF